MLATEGVGAEGITSWKITEGETATSGAMMAMSFEPDAGVVEPTTVGVELSRHRLCQRPTFTVEVLELHAKSPSVSALLDAMQLTLPPAE